METSRLFRLKSSIQNYSWGSRDALSKLFGIPNPANEPQAEIWMGAHPKSPSLVEIEQGQYMPLDQLIQQHGRKILGDDIACQFDGKLPFLFKVLSAAEPLSIQAHPNKAQAEQGFKKENDTGISLNAPFRNYRDDNHKPELIYALTPFKAMCAFRPLEQIAAYFRLLNNRFIDEQLDMLTSKFDETGLKQFYATLMQASNEQIADIITDAFSAASTHDDLAFKTLCNLVEKYPADIGVLSPLLLNIVELQPKEALFLDAGTLHAYLEGTGLEVMASSDNVLRGGLTPKHVDVPELLATIDFRSVASDQLKLPPRRVERTIEYPVPVNDFSYTLLPIEQTLMHRQSNAVSLLFCNAGHFLAQDHSHKLHLKPGDACLVPANTEYSLSGKGEAVIISCCGK
ncbi:MAG: mannose-6-phosphate isomerase, class I [Endozoicomonas sp. (ex Botrylloides leachii)]|nr:mannose-6-phosphate isomerase, class I [Endozoicomonas sp. (ex Botrylloides leachii)]